MKGNVSMRDRFALDSDGILFDAYEALSIGGIFLCAHPGCTARVHPQWGPGHKEAFFYAFPGCIHDHSQEGDHTILSVRKPLSVMINRLITGPQHIPPPRPKVPAPKKPIQTVTPVIRIDKYRNISALSQLYSTGICSTPGFYSTKIDDELIGDYLTTYVDRRYLFDNLFISQSSSSILSGPHIIELIPDRFTSSGFRAYQAYEYIIENRKYRAYINININISDPDLNKILINRCFTYPHHMFLACATFTEQHRPSLGKDNIWRVTYNCNINRASQIAVCPDPIVRKQPTNQNKGGHS